MRQTRDREGHQAATNSGACLGTSGGRPVNSESGERLEPTVSFPCQALLLFRNTLRFTMCALAGDARGEGCFLDGDRCDCGLGVEFTGETEPRPSVY
jgi:hypothetical protein